MGEREELGTLSPQDLEEARDVYFDYHMMKWGTLSFDRATARTIWDRELEFIVYVYENYDINPAQPIDIDFYQGLIMAVDD